MHQLRDQSFYGFDALPLEEHRIRTTDGREDSSRRLRRGRGVAVVVVEEDVMLRVELMILFIGLCIR